MADGFGHGGFSGAPYPFWLSSPSPSPHPSGSAPPFLATYPVNLNQGGFDPTISQGSYHRSPSDWSNNPSYGGPSLSQTPSSSFYVNNGSFGHRGEDYSYTHMLPPPSGLCPSRETSSDYLLESQRVDRMPYKFSVSPVESSATLSPYSEPFYNPIPPSGVYHGQYHPGHDKFESFNAVSGPPWVLPQALFVPSHAPENIQSSLPGSSPVEPVNFNVLLGYGESTGHVKPLSQNQDLHDETGQTSSHPLQFDSKSSEKREGSGVSSLYQTPKTFLADSENGVSETSLKNAIIDDLNCDEHRSWRNHFMVSSQGPSAPTMFSVGSESFVAMKADNGDASQSAINCKAPSDACANQPSEDVQECKFQKQMFDMMNGDNKTTSLTDMGIKGSCSKSNTDDVSTGQGNLMSPASCSRVTSVVDAMHNLSKVLVYECFNNGSCLKPEQLENLDKAVENLTKCLKKSTGNNKTTAVEASNIPTQAMHVSCANVVDLNEASNVIAKDCEGFNVKALDNFGLKDPVDKDKYEDEMTQGIKSILASNFPDGEENHPQTLLYKSLWLETEAALCSATCMTRYHRIKNEIGNLKLQNREISADASTFMQEPFLNPQKSVSIMNNVEQEATDSFIKQGSNSANAIVTMSHDAPQRSRFNSNPVNAVLSLMSRSFIGGSGEEYHGNFKPGTATSGKIPDTIQQESPGFTTEEKHNDVIDRFQILKQQETKRKLKSQNCSKTRIDDHEENPEANSEVADSGRSSQMSDVMDRFKILKRREAEQVQKSLNSLDTDSDSEKDKPRNKSQICDHPWSESMMTIGGNSVKETCADTEEPSAPREGYEGPTSDWEHVRKYN